MTDLVNELRGTISRYFRIEDVRWSEQTIAFYITMEESSLENNFNSLRKELIPRGFVPALVREQFDHIIYITKKPQIQPRSVYVNIVMFFLTIISTIWAGAVQWAPRAGYEFSSENAGGYLREMFGMLGNAELVGNGALYFALPLMLILGIHELGHYYMSKRHNVDASLPFFIPIPPFIGPLGTFGAFISMREPMPSKKALMDIGAAGPVAGFLVAIPVTIIGLYLTGANPVEPELEGDIITFIGQPLLFWGLESIIPIPHGASIHPTAFAGWVGLLVTAMNLLPAGQLDGGHIMRALFGSNSKYISYFVVMVLIVLGFLFAGWWIFTFLILMLGTSHPPPLNDITRLSPGRKAIGVFAVVMLIVCFIPIPIQVAEIPDFEVNTIDNGLIAMPGETVNFTLITSNMASESLTYEIELQVISIRQYGDYREGWEFNNSIESLPVYTVSGWTVELESQKLTIGRKRVANYRIEVTVPADALLGDELAFEVKFLAEENPYVKGSINLDVRVGELSIGYDRLNQNLSPGSYYDFHVRLENKGTRTIVVELNASINSSTRAAIQDWNEPVLNRTPFAIQPQEVLSFSFTVQAPETAKKGELAVIEFSAHEVSNSTVFDSAKFKVKVV